MTTTAALPALEPERLLEALRTAWDQPKLRYRQTPQYLSAGGEAVIDAFQLDAARPPADCPLVLRRLLPVRKASQPAETRQLDWEAAIHGALRELQYPVPRVLHVELDPAVLGAPFLVAERASGEALLDAVRNPSTLAAHPSRLPALVGDALFRVPAVLAEIQAQLHDLDTGPIHRHLGDAGLRADAIRFDARLETLTRRIESSELPGLEAGLDWIRRRRTAPDTEVICHGDLLFTNLLVEGRRVSAVFDWSTATLAEPEFDVAATLARLSSRVPGTPWLLDGLFRTVQSRLSSRYLACYRRRRPLDPIRLDYFEAYWILSELAWGGARLRAGAAFDGSIEHRWLHPATIATGVERFARLTGVALEPLQPAEA